MESNECFRNLVIGYCLKNRGEQGQMVVLENEYCDKYESFEQDDGELPVCEVCGSRFTWIVGEDSKRKIVCCNCDVN
jgi:hypothetical protein